MTDAPRPAAVVPGSACSPRPGWLALAALAAAGRHGAGGLVAVDGGGAPWRGLTRCPLSPNGSASAATVSGLVKIYPTATGETHALRGVDAEFHEHTVTALTGPSGSGKSTLLALLALRDRPSGGDVTILGRNASSLAPASAAGTAAGSSPGYPSARPTGPPHLTAAQNVEQAARWRGAPSSAEHGLLERLGLEQVAGVTASRLSGGEQQRVALACACVGAPRLILRDEPTAELDEDTAALVMHGCARWPPAGAPSSSPPTTPERSRPATASSPSGTA